MLDQHSQGVSGNRIAGIVIGAYVGTKSDIALVFYPRSNPSAALPARTLVDPGTLRQGDAVALAFEGGDPSCPIILGRLEEPPMSTRSNKAGPADHPACLDFTSPNEVTLRCGKASITLTREGKIILRGTYISSRSSGVNRIKGGSVQIN